MEFLNLREYQRDCLERIFRTQSRLSSTTGADIGHWKILVFDDFTKALLSPILSIQRLRKLGVTLHLDISSKREAVPEVPVVYFIAPTKENIDKIAEDCKLSLYDEVYVHFSHSVSKDLLEYFAKRTVEVNSAALIKRIFDQFLGFISLDKDLFQLNISESFVSYNLPSLQETEVMKFLSQVSDGLVNVVTTLKISPIIRCPKGGPSALLSQLLCRKLYLLFQDPEYQDAFFIRDASLPSQNLEEISLKAKRPILFICDRGVDLSTMLFHSSGYEPLVDDLLKISSNRVTIPPTTEEKEKLFSLDSEKDEFWRNFRGKSIPEVVENHSAELQKVSAQVQKIRLQTSAGELDVAEEAQSQTSSGLLKIVDSLPALLEKKKILEMHLDIIKATMSQVGEREVHTFAELEERMMTRRYGELSEVVKLLHLPHLQFVDKARLVAVYLLTANPRVEESAQVLEQLEAAKSQIHTQKVNFKTSEAMNTVLYIKKLQSMNANLLKQNLSSAATSTVNSSIWRLADKAAQGFLEAQKKVKGIVFSENLSPIVQMLDLVTRAKSPEEAPTVAIDDEFLYFDPKLSDDPSKISAYQKYRGQISTGVVFVLGGGSYAEYENLKSYCSANVKSKSAATQVLGLTSNETKKRFVYGSTEMLNATEFMNQVSKCLAR